MSSTPGTGQRGGSPCRGEGKASAPQPEAALTNDNLVPRVRADEVGGLARGVLPRGQGPVRVAVGVVQVEAVDVAAPQRWLTLHGAGVAEVSCKDRAIRVGRGPQQGPQGPAPYLCRGWYQRRPRRGT